MKNYSLATFWDSRVVNKQTKQSRIMLSVTINSNNFLLTLKGLKCTKVDYDKSFTPRFNTDVQREIKSFIDVDIERATSILNRLGNSASKDLFLKFFKNRIISSTEKTDLYKIWDEGC
jgi:predicted transcriptional regulator